MPLSSATAARAGRFGSGAQSRHVTHREAVAPKDGEDGDEDEEEDDE